MSEKTGILEILRTGPGTSVQDLGRRHGSDYGIPSSGVMDQKSFLWINHVLQNHPNSAALEISQPGLKIQFSASTRIAIAGGKAVTKINSAEVENPGLISVQAGDVLELGNFLLGSRIYLGIKSGFQTKLWLKSRSFFEPLTGKSVLKKGDTVSYEPVFSQASLSFSKPKWKVDWIGKEEIGVFPGPDWHLLTEEQKITIKESVFHISGLTNRMGVQLEEALENQIPELPTNPVFPGTVQLTPGGKLIILMKDAGVTGGYPRILQLAEESISIISQKKPCDSIRFFLNDFKSDYQGVIN
jgi:biotin-dependent carboxylase-like uncharacterized protein